MFKITQKGNFKKSLMFLNRISKPVKKDVIEFYAAKGIEALRMATPKDTGETAASWYSKIQINDDRLSIQFCNSNIQNGVPIAIILQYGHATRNGGWVEGRDYINPSIQPVFDEITKQLWREVIRI